MLFSISYVLLSLIAVMHAIPVDASSTHQSEQTAPSHPPPHAVSLLDPRRLPPPPSRFPPQPPRDKIYLTFMFGTQPTGDSVPLVIEEEITLIFTEYRRHLDVHSRSFRFVFRNGYDGDIHDNLHDVMFWGEGVGEDCQTRREPCKVQYNDPVLVPSVPVRPDTHLATVLSDVAVTATTAVLFNVGSAKLCEDYDDDGRRLG
ncbi:hypothetical protein F5050DRAFT_1715988 [Lentinula boryana]|uniref:Uncharacterized protein n=1 Tax=Lentinula boryana TaxID=40481 RepID=A0ABQ8PYL4_9AGAR|nr:hypothetical protein F5050DRAFT_1715988 [Lentinula boryana]